MARSAPFSAHPRESGDPGVFRFGAWLGHRRGAGRSEAQKTWVPAFAGMSGVLGSLAPTIAFAHEGDHEGMSLVEGARHLLTQPDHLAMLALLAAFVGFGGWRLYRDRTPR
jgi:CDP-diglyceride synthetase